MCCQIKYRIVIHVQNHVSWFVTQMESGKTPDANGVFSKAPIFNFNDDKLKFDTNDVSNANDNYGSVSGFVPQNWYLYFERLNLLLSWSLRSNFFKGYHLWYPFFFFDFWPRKIFIFLIYYSLSLGSFIAVYGLLSPNSFSYEKSTIRIMMITVIMRVSLL